MIVETRFNGIGYSDAEAKAFCTKQYGSDSNLYARCMKEASGLSLPYLAPWTDVGRSQRGLPAQSIVGAGLDAGAKAKSAINVNPAKLRVGAASNRGSNATGINRLKIRTAEFLATEAANNEPSGQSMLEEDSNKKFMIIGLGLLALGGLVYMKRKKS